MLNHLFVLSKTKDTSQYESFFLFSVPAKITSCILLPRKALLDCSPNTQRIASLTLLFPQPFGPTIAVIPPSKLILVKSANDLKPTISISLKVIISSPTCFIIAKKRYKAKQIWVHMSNLFSCLKVKFLDKRLI